MPTKDEKQHMARVASLGCIVQGCCRPAEVHHITGAGMDLRASHYDTIPLCPYHHRLGPFGEAVHNGTKAFEMKHGSQEWLLQETKRLMERKYGEGK